MFMGPEGAVRVIHMLLVWMRGSQMKYYPNDMLHYLFSFTQHYYKNA